MKQKLSECPMCGSDKIKILKLKNSTADYEHCQACGENFYGANAMEHLESIRPISKKRLAIAM